MSDPIQAQVTVVPGALDYTTPSPYYPGSLWIYINGLLKEQDGVEGVDELGGNAFRLREPLRTGDTLHVYYQESGSTAAPFPTPPRAYAALDLVPVASAALDLVPVPYSTEDTTVDTGSPLGLRAINLVPDGAAALDLVPVPLSAKEE